ncbi:MAG: hypothetical protein K8S98_12025 [Planctomycetes bacterium]|nr:hypothetical protein [Planctomycetota bacterium]
MQDPLRKLALSDGRYSPEALRFLLESLDHALRLAGKEHAEGPSRHVTGREVLAGMRAYASEIFGPLAAQVWRSWGVRETMDWGRIVFLMVDAGLLKRQETDTIDDFAHGFDFDDAFVARYVPTLPPAIDAGLPSTGGATGTEGVGS